MTAARHSIMQEGVPYRFPFVAVKFISNRERLNATAVEQPDWRARAIQVSGLEFCGAGDEMFSVPGASTVVIHMAYKGSHYVSNPPRSIDEVNYSEAFGRLFDGNTRTKLCRLGVNALENNRRPGFFDVSDATFSNVIGFGENTDYGDTLDAGETGESQARRLLGSIGFVGFTAVMALGDGASLDIQRFSKWRFYNANDNSGQQGRTWVWGEILGSADGRKWWMLDRFKDASITDANYALAYEGQLAVQGKGDLISDLDLNEWYS